MDTICLKKNNPYSTSGIYKYTLFVGAMSHIH